MHPSLPFVLLLPVAILVAGCGPKEPVTTQGARPAHVSPPRPSPSRPAPPREAAVNSIYQGALKARLDDEFAAVVLADGRKTVVPLDSLASEDLAYLTQLAAEKPLVAAGRSSVVVVKSTDARGPKKTIEISQTEGPVETVKLCAPNLARAQIGATCMLYARVHWLDIAGYYVDLPTIFTIINDTPPDEPWKSPKYVAGLDGIMTGFKSKPVMHPSPPGPGSFDWARAELRRGRPILAALPRAIVEVLPGEFLALYPWGGGSIGHQIVVNGFTWNKATNEGSFHIVNTWEELPEFDIPTRYITGDALVFEASLSPVGEMPTPEELAAATEVVQEVTYIKDVGGAQLFEVTTNLGVRRVVAANSAAARRMIEKE